MEKPLTDDQAAALYGATDPTTGAVYPNTTANNWGLARNRFDARLIAAAALAENLRVFAVEDNPDAVGVRAGLCHINGTDYDYAGADPAVDGLADNDTTYLWLEDDGGGSPQIGSAIDATGWPGTAHFKLAKVTLAAGEITAIKDMRAQEVFRK